MHNKAIEELKTFLHPQKKLNPKEEQEEEQEREGKQEGKQPKSKKQQQQKKNPPKSYGRKRKNLHPESAVILPPSVSYEEAKELLQNQPIFTSVVQFIKEIGFIDTTVYCPLGIPYLLRLIEDSKENLLVIALHTHNFVYALNQVIENIWQQEEESGESDRLSST